MPYTTSPIGTDIQDSESGLPRIPLPRTPLNKAPEDNLVAPGPARVGVVLPTLHGDELPLVKARTEFELKHTGCADLLGLHARFVRAFYSPARRTARPDDELADAPGRRTFATGGYAGVALVAVGVSREDDVGVLVIELIPEGPHLGAIVFSIGSIERVVEVGQRALRWVLGEVCAEPAPLGGAPATPTDLLTDAVEDHDVPGSSIVGVVASPALARTPWEVIEVGLRPGGVVLVEANRGPGALLVLAPGRIVAVAELRAGAVGVGVVADGEDGSPYFAQQTCRFAVPLLVAAVDISRADQRHSLRLAGARLGRQHDRRHGCQHHRRSHRTDNKNGLAHPLHPALCG